MRLQEILAGWLPHQRWYAGKDAAITGVAITQQTVLAHGDPGLRHLIIAVSQDGTVPADRAAGGGPSPADGGGASAGSEPSAAGVRAHGQADRYQLLVGLRSTVPDRLSHAIIGPAGDGMIAYDGLHDPALTHLLLAAMAEGRAVGGLRFAHEPNARIDTELDSFVLSGEQSNSSLLFGEEAILKVIRRPTPGKNPDLEVPRVLSRLGSRHVAPPLGWVEGAIDGQTSVLAILSTYLRGATDGWTLAATSVRDLYASESTRAALAGGDFAPESARLGEATAEVHQDLAKAFGVQELPGTAHAGLAHQMRARLAAALAVVPELASLAGKLHAAFDDLAALDGPLPVQRIHGDYHLGQAMRTPDGWVLLDFEGEPNVPLSQRHQHSPALRDVAGMLRSFDYAARYQLAGRDDSEQTRAAARDWAGRNQSAFCEGYAQAGGADPGKHVTLLRALSLDKAVYEVVYEARHRPSWLPIPLESIADA
jgi:maltokinase